jgi:uncharacterized membrane protein YqjE
MPGREDRMTVNNERTLPEVMNDIVGNFQEIIVAEFQLAKTEFKEEISKASAPAVTFGVGLVISFFALGFLLLASVYALSIVMASWLAALWVGATLTVVGVALISSGGKKLKEVNVLPEKTAGSLKENMQWAKNQIK